MYVVFGWVDPKSLDSISCLAHIHFYIIEIVLIFNMSSKNCLFQWTASVCTVLHPEFKLTIVPFFPLLFQAIMRAIAENKDIALRELRLVNQVSWEVVVVMGIATHNCQYNFGVFEL